MIRKKIVGIMGSGLIGRDPFDKRSWSGSSHFFFKTCLKHGILERAFGVEVPTYINLPIKLRNFSPIRELWRQKFYLDTGYYKQLAHQIYKQLIPSDFKCNILQIGGIYDVPELVNGRCKCFSYHDGNLAQLIKSPYMPKKIPKKIVDKALDYERNVYKKMDKIFTMSDYLRKSFVDDFGILKEKVIDIGAGINLEEIPAEIVKNYDNQRIVFVGIRFYRKGGFILLKAFRNIKEKYPKAVLHIIGPRKLNIPQNLSNGVIFHGFLSKYDKAQKKIFNRILSESSLFVMPSLYEPFGIAPLEAMVNQIPCILTDDWAFPEMIKSGVNGYLIECNSVEDLTEKMKNLIGNPDLLNKMGIAARQVVLQNYTWDIVVNKMINALYD